MQTSHISEPSSKPLPVFIAGTGCHIPAGTPEGYVFQQDGLHKLGAGEGGKLLLLCPPFEVVGWDEQERIVLKKPAQ